ncbi:MAG: ATP-binding protein [Nitrospirota bacterium]|nr:ATP-binding protein [Nitrospirota bacterium]
MRVGTKLTIGVGAVLVLVGIGYGSYYLLEQGRYVRAALLRHAGELADILAAAHTSGLGPEQLAHVAQAASGDAGLVWLRITDAAGETLAEWPGPGATADPAADARMVNTASGGQAAGQTADLPQHRFLPNSRPPALIYTAPLGGHKHLTLMLAGAEEDAALFRTRNVDIAMVAVITLALLLIVSHLSRLNVAFPLARLTRTVQRFGEGDRAARHQHPEPGEIGLLAGRFNDMAATIQGQTSELVREREYERSIVQNIFSGVVGLDPDGTVTTWNAAMAMRYAVPPEEAVGRPLAGLSPLVLPREVVAASHALLAGEARQFSLPGLRHRAERVGERVLDVRGRALLDPSGAVFGAVLAVDDRTEQARLTEQLQHAEKLATIGQLAAGLAHEIGTPLNVISGRAEFVLKKLPEDDALRRHLERIVAQIDRISGIVQQMLVFARKRPPERRHVQLAAVLSGVADLLAHPLERAGIVLRLDIPDDLHLLADPDQVQQVAMNLLVNAQHALVSGGAITVSARTLCVAERGATPWVRLEVADTGPGMNEAVRAHIFDPFFTTKEPGKGTGMGLTVCHGIVTAHDGWIEVDSQPGRGAVFAVYLPQGETPGETPGESRTGPPAARATPPPPEETTP